MASPTITLVSRLILEHNNHILFLEQTDRNGGKFSLPGGKVDDGETPLAALFRECKEEADIELKAENIELAHVLYRRKKTETIVVMYYKALAWQGTVVSKEPKKFKKVTWCAWNNLPKKISTVTAFVLQQYQQGIVYSEIMQ
jgi:8-oxo-dGTP diphosphatase